MLPEADNLASSLNEITHIWSGSSNIIRHGALNRKRDVVRVCHIVYVSVLGLDELVQTFPEKVTDRISLWVTSKLKIRVFCHSKITWE